MTPSGISNRKNDDITDFRLEITSKCHDLKKADTRGDLGRQIAVLVLRHPPSDIQQMKQNFSNKIRNLTPEYRDKLTKKIHEHLLGTYQTIRLRHQQGTPGSMQEQITPLQRSYWDMVADQCSGAGDDTLRIRFLKYLLAAYCMFVLKEPGHAVGTPFPGGDTVQRIDGVCYCPVREKSGDVDAALCPFCPALQIPEIGYLKPPVNAGRHKKQEFIEHCHRFHNFNG
jgi:uncharacterized protein (UPF0305 family)